MFGEAVVCNCSGLDSLRRMLPELRVIGGVNMVLHYSLVIYQNTDLREVGLDKLAEITNGGVRVAQNPNLCFASSINWRKLTKSEKINDVLVEHNSGQFCLNGRAR